MTDRRPIESTCLLTILLGLVLLLPGGCPLPMDNNSPANGTPNNPFDEDDQSLRNEPPVADAGADQAVSAGQLVTLSGTGSNDPDNDALTFRWRQVDGAPSVSLTGAFTAIARFDAPAVDQSTTLTFRLTVVDGFATDHDDIRVTVSPGD